MLLFTVATRHIFLLFYVAISILFPVVSFIVVIAIVILYRSCLFMPHNKRKMIELWFYLWAQNKNLFIVVIIFVSCVKELFTDYFCTAFNDSLWSYYLANNYIYYKGDYWQRYAITLLNYENWVVE